MQLGRKSRVKYGKTPRVDLLPAGQRAEILHERVMVRLLAAIVVSAIVAGLISFAGILPKQVADQRLQAAEAGSQELLVQISELTETQSAINDSAKLTRMRAELTEGEVIFAALAEEVAELLPDGLDVTGFEGSLVSAETPEQTLGTLCTADAATITVVVAGPDLSNTPNYTQFLESVTGFTCILATQIEHEEQDTISSVTLKLALDEEALAQRFVEEAE